MTGTFDDWAKSVKLDNKGEHFEKLVELPVSDEKIFYKVRYLTATPFLYDDVSPIYKAQIELFQGIIFTSPHHRKVVDARVRPAV